MESTALKMFTETVKEENNIIWIKPLCDFFQINVQNQHRKLKNDAVFGKLWTKKSADFGEIDKNGRIMLTKKGFLRWIQIINPNLISDDLREKFTEYQEKVSDYLFGTMEEHEAISATMQQLNDWKTRYSEAGNMVKQKQKELQELLNQRYQYRLPFTEAKQLPT